MELVRLASILLMSPGQGSILCLVVERACSLLQPAINSFSPTHFLGQKQHDLMLGRYSGAWPVGHLGAGGHIWHLRFAQGSLPILAIVFPTAAIEAVMSSFGFCRALAFAMFLSACVSLLTGMQDPYVLLVPLP